VNKKNNSKKHKIEHWIIENLKEGKFSEKEPLPSIEKMTKQFDVSNMTVHATLNKLRHLGILYSKKSVGFYPSPFFRKFFLIDTKDSIHAFEVHARKISKIPPVFFEEKFIDKKNSNINFSNWRGYEQIYYNDSKEKLAYNISWVAPEYSMKKGNDGDVQKEIKKIKEDILNDVKNKVDLIYMEPNKELDKEQLDKIDNLTYLPTIYSAYLNNNGKILQIRVEKIHPFKFIHNSITTKVLE